MSAVGYIGTAKISTSSLISSDSPTGAQTPPAVPLAHSPLINDGAPVASLAAQIMPVVGFSHSLLAEASMAYCTNGPHSSALVARTPQSEQSVPIPQASYSAPGPPSSHMPSEA